MVSRHSISCPKILTGKSPKAGPEAASEIDTLSILPASGCTLSQASANTVRVRRPYSSTGKTKRELQGEPQIEGRAARRSRER